MLQKFDERTATCSSTSTASSSTATRPGVSPFDSAVQGGDAVWEGLRLYDGRIFKLTEHLDRLRSSALALAFAADPVARADHRADPPHPRRQPHARRRPHPADADARRQGHLRHGPAPEPRRPDADRPGRAQAAGLRHGQRHHADHQQRPAVPARLPRPEDPPLQPDPVDPGQDRGQPRRRRRRADARPRGFVAETNATHLFLVDAAARS